MKITQVLIEAEVRAKKRSKKVIKEDVELTEKKIREYFKIDGEIKITPDGINVSGDVRSWTYKDKDEFKPPAYVYRIEKIPFKFNIVAGNFDVQEFSNLKTLENFPRKCVSIDISNNQVITELIGGDEIECQRFSADYLNLTSLQGAPVARYYSFIDNEKLKSTDGLPMSKIESINLKGCTNLKDIKELSQPISLVPSVKSKVPYIENIPLVGIILGLNSNIRLLDIDVIGKMPDKLEGIIREYKGRGMGAAIELIRALRDKGFTGHARIR